MSKDFLPTDYSNVDFSFVYDLDENGLDIFFGVTDTSIAAMKEALQEDALRDNQYLKSLTTPQLEEIIEYYTRLLDLYTDFELYEECENLVEVLDIIEDFYNRSKK